MAGKDYTENTRVQVPAALHLVRLGYQYIDDIPAGSYNSEGNILLGILEDRMRALNPGREEEELRDAENKLIQSLQNVDLGRAYHEMITSTSGVKFIDFENPDNNRWNVTTEFTCENEKTHDNFRPDLTVFVNGLPVVFIEVKKPQNQEGIVAEQNRINTRMANRAFRSFFNATEFMIFSNNEEYDDEQQPHLSGAFYSTPSSGKAFFNLFREEDKELLGKTCYRRELSEAEEMQVLKHRNCPQLRVHPEYIDNCQPDTPTNRLITSMLSRERLLFILRYGIAYVDQQKETAKGEKITVLEKHIMRYQQLFATFAIRRKMEEGVQSGIIWHTQGSGKTALAYYNVKSLTDWFARRDTPVKFYFIVDRLDLLEQAAGEFQMRGMMVRTAQDRKTLMRDFDDNTVVNNPQGRPEIMVVNIQRFAEDHDRVVIKNTYNTRLKRIFFIDEAHRGYSPKGSFLANLFSADPKSIKIALTGTPLLVSERESWRVFGDYIHTYYYDKSISDGYTLKLMREEIETRYREELNEIIEKLVKDVQVKRSDVDMTAVIEHENYLTPVLRYIVRDMKRSRIQHDSPQMGGMIVCQTNQQARNMYQLLSEKWETVSEGDSERLNAVLILHDEGDKSERKESIDYFKKREGTDLLIVNAMLLTGFDAPRLKKLYLMKSLQQHTLLQALTRVNRRYGDFRYGYVVDFAGIKENFVEANNRYLKELNETTAETGIEEEKKVGEVLMVSPEEMTSVMNKIQNQLFNYTLNNTEEFRREVEEVDDKTELYALRHTLEEARALSNQVASFGSEELKQQFKELQIESLSSLISEVGHRIMRINLVESNEHKADVAGIIREALSLMEFECKKIKEEELRIEFNDLMDRYDKIKQEFDSNIDQMEDKYVMLSEDFRRFMQKRGFKPSNVAEAEEEIGYMEEVLKKIREINRRNRVLQSKYKNDEKYVRVHKRIQEKNQTGEKPLISRNDVVLMKMLNEIKSAIDAKIWGDSHVMDNEGYFGQMVMKAVTNEMDRQNIEADRGDREWLRSRIAAEYLETYMGRV